MEGILDSGSWIFSQQLMLVLVPWPVWLSGVKSSHTNLWICQKRENKSTKWNKWFCLDTEYFSSAVEMRKQKRERRFKLGNMSCLGLSHWWPWVNTLGYVQTSWRLESASQFPRFHFCCMTTQSSTIIFLDHDFQIKISSGLLQIFMSIVCPPALLSKYSCRLQPGY